MFSAQMTVGKYIYLFIFSPPQKYHIQALPCTLPTPINTQYLKILASKLAVRPSIENDPADGGTYLLPEDTA